MLLLLNIAVNFLSLPGKQWSKHTE